ncbi:PAS domain-containing protein [uncultured Parvibaculum sp.]|uniref:PAS domain-containing protein n=1 Tax=uncultured Parvibaculum sp. TaxID=291828 RepID=UPI0030DBD48F|tara:strand:- start:24309 stop:24818 length:510 start_codon:yes stop_codon:yes gene_type:complete
MSTQAPEALRLAPFDVFIDPLLSLQDARLRDMLAYWNGKRAGRPCPARADVSPADIVSHLPSVFLVDAAPPALALAHFRVRLMGTALNELFSRDFTGRTLESDISEKPAAAIAKVLGVVCQLRRPLRVYGAAVFAKAGPATEIEAVLLPLSAGSGVDMVMGELVKRASA